jgi:SUKH-4 immunity protein/Xanthomonas XOO_2897-like deaminase
VVTFAQAQERAELWVNGGVPSYQRREVRVREFDLGFVCWAVDRPDGPHSDDGQVRLVIARETGEATLWPALPIGEVVRRYGEEYGTTAAAPAPEPPKRTDLEATSFLLSPPQWLQDAADAAGIPDNRPRTGPPSTPAPSPAAASAAPTPWAGTDTNESFSDTGSVPPPPTVFAPPLTQDDSVEDAVPADAGAAARAEARTELLPAGSIDLGVQLPKITKRLPAGGEAPQDAVPEDAVPGGVPPGGMAPGDAAPGDAVPLHTPPPGPAGGPSQGFVPQGMQDVPPHGPGGQGVLPHQGVPSHGVPPQGVAPQGMPPQGGPAQGMPPQGGQSQGAPPQGMPPQGAQPQGAPPQGVPSYGGPSQGGPDQGAPQGAVPPPMGQQPPPCEGGLAPTMLAHPGDPMFAPQPGMGPAPTPAPSPEPAKPKRGLFGRRKREEESGAPGGQPPQGMGPMPGGPYPPGFQPGGQAPGAPQPGEPGGQGYGYPQQEPGAGYGYPQAGPPQPGPSQSGMPQSGLAQSGLAQSGPSQPGPSQPGLQQPGLPQPGMAQPGSPQSGPPQPGPPQPGPAGPGGQHAAPTMFASPSGGPGAPGPHTPPPGPGGSGPQPPPPPPGPGGPGAHTPPPPPPPGYARSAADIADESTTRAPRTPPPPSGPSTPPPGAGGYVPTQLMQPVSPGEQGGPPGPPPPPGAGPHTPPPSPGDGGHAAPTMLAQPHVSPGGPPPPPPGPAGLRGAPGGPPPPPPPAPGGGVAPPPPPPGGFPQPGGPQGPMGGPMAGPMGGPVGGPMGGQPMPGQPAMGRPPMGQPMAGQPMPGQPMAPSQPGVPTVGPGYMAVLRYRAPDGSEQQIIRRSAPGTPHPEWQILHELRSLNVPPQHVLELHTELESCDLPGGYCLRMIRESWPSVRISHTAPYGRDHASRQQGVNHLIEHQGELHQVAAGPALPRPQRVPLPHPNQVQRIAPVPPDGIAQEIAQAFGPQGIFRFDQRAVSRAGVPEAVASTLVWAGLPVDFGPFFWAQAQPGRPVPTLAELAAERGRQAGADAASYLVMGNDFGRQLCVQYGTAAIVAVPLEADPGGAPAAPQFVNSGLPEFVRCLALLGRMWRLRVGLTPEQAGRWTVDFQAGLAGLDPAALSSPDNWWGVLLEQMWDGLL